MLLKKTAKNPNINFHDGNEDMNAKDDTIDKCSSDDTKHVNDHKSAHHVTTQDTDVKAKDDSPDVNANIVRKPEKVKSGECFFCGEQTLNTCKFCDNIFFCSQVSLHKYTIDIKSRIIQTILVHLSSRF